jgi:hypothetical protein
VDDRLAIGEYQGGGGSMSTVEEDARELGLDPGAALDRAAVRQAYLRGVKLRKPEVDPDGFRRLREAYERLLARVEVSPPAPPAAAPTAPLPAVPPAPAPPDPLEPYRRRIAEIPAAETLRRVTVAYQAYAHLSGHPGARALLLDHLAGPDHRHEAVRILVEGLRTADRNCLARRPAR